MSGIFLAACKSPSSDLQNLFIMPNNQIKIIWRNLFKYPVYSFINLTGLSIVIAASFILLLYVKQELSYERHIPDSERVYRIATDFYNMGGFANSQPILTYYLSTEAKDVEYATAGDRSRQKTPVQIDKQIYQEEEIYLIDSSFFQVFPFPIKEGQVRASLAPDEAIVTEDVSKKYFKKESPIGKMLAVGNRIAPPSF